jgi:hypothetical protein
MSSEFFTEAGKVLLGAVIGGALTAATALPVLNTKLAKTTTVITAMKDSCITCRSGFDTTLTTLGEAVRVHHEDDEKHNTKASHILLQDILTRVMRIEDKLVNGALRHMDG